MPQTKTIKIFLGSSITDLKDDRVSISDSISQDLTHLFQQDDIFIQFFKFENIHTDNSGQGAQEEIDKILRKCDISLFVFKDKEGPYTIHEYEVARELQIERTHKIFVYYFHKEEGKQPEKLTPFQERLSADGVFWKEYTDVIDLKYQITLGLLKYLNVRSGESAYVAEEVKKSGDALFEQREQDIKLLHQEIEKLLAQIDLVMKDPDTPISAKINNVIGIYQKADLWASKTDYDKKKYYDLLLDYASFLYDYGLYKDAESVYLRQIPLAEELYGAEHENTAIIYNNIGLVYHEQGDYGKAMEYNQKALEILEKVLGTEHPLTATSYNNIGGMYDAQGDYVKALEYYQKALDIREKVLGTEHPNTAISYNNIAGIYYAQGDYVKALVYYQKALVIDEKVLGTDHPDTATSYNNIAGIYYAQGDYGKALEYYQKALAIREKVLGTEHPSTANSYNNVGSVYKEQGDYVKALEYYFKAMAIRENVLGTRHPSTAASYNNIGKLYDIQGEHDKALDYFNKADFINKNNFEDEQYNTKDAEEVINIIDTADKLRVTLMESSQHISMDVLSESTIALRSFINCTECSLWFINYNSTRTNDQDNNTISVSLIHREICNDVTYSFRKDMDYVHKIAQISLDSLMKVGNSDKHFLRLNNKSPELFNFVSQEFVKKRRLKDFIIIPIPDEQDKTKIIALMEISHGRRLYDDLIWKELSSIIQHFFYTAFQRYRILQKQQLMEEIIDIHGKLKDKNIESLFNSIVYVLDKACPFQGASLFMWDNYQNRYNLIATTGYISDSQHGVYYHKGEGLTGSIGVHAKPFVTENLIVEEMTFCEISKDKAKTGMFIPICSPSDEMEVVGIIRMVNKLNTQNNSVVDYFNDADVSLMQFAANYLALIIDHYQKETDHNIFIDKLTHEIITPANAIWKTAYQLYTHIADNVYTNKHLMSYLKNIIDFAELQRWQASTNLFLSRNRRKQPFDVRYSIKLTSLYNVIGKSINIVTPIAKKYNVPDNKITIDSKSDPLLKIKIDENAFIMIFYNLFTNAIKYHDPNPQEQFHICVSYALYPDNLSIDVEDNGIGIDEKDKDAIFENGYRSESAIRQNASGYGIGLTVIKQIVEDFGGTISLASLKKPTIFRITIPNNKIQ